MTTLGPLFEDGLLKAGRPHGDPHLSRHALELEFGD
jgi:hypothetical protein